MRCTVLHGKEERSPKNPSRLDRVMSLIRSLARPGSGTTGHVRARLGPISTAQFIFSQDKLHRTVYFSLEGAHGIDP
ncbi:hypothetical protein F4827_002192 [Paraburkholderia bannensis]|uniref:Uncharacterized protein n=1 Tax=Paraburkholderia bannensis TaxID=765414 RepID=A0A7W9WT28_9BURK|nr:MULTISPECIES: hypothetical protein [Paraburkholderia]MBB3257261.1 hypothetical protein [Paraburkholderia sp. WP4_3_2]MBB6102343.1 hypothetical protein [Paraburkholderia bannensis]